MVLLALVIDVDTAPDEILPIVRFEKISAQLRTCAAMEAQHDASSTQPWHTCFEGADFINLCHLSMMQVRPMHIKVAFNRRTARPQLAYPKINASNPSHSRLPL